MAKRGDPKILRFVVLFLRHYADMFQSEFGEAARVAQGTISECEAGKIAPSEEALRRMAAVAGVPWPLVVLLRRFLTTLHSWLDSGSAPPLPLEEVPVEQAALEATLLAVTSYRIDEAAADSDLPPRHARQEAEEIWAALELFPLPERRRWIELSVRAAGSWALAERISHASALAAGHDVKEALALAELALSIAWRVPGEAPRARTVGYCSGFLANVLRVANEWEGAGAAFAQAGEFWQAGEAARSLPLAEWRLLDLEASLHTDRRQFSAALDRLDQALAACGADALAVGRILTKKAHVLERLGDPAGSLKVLQEAAPTIETSGDPQLFFALRFNIVTNLVALSRYEEAAARLPEVRALATEQGRKLHLTRLTWLESKVAAAQGRVAEALAGLEQVVREFADLPYEAALASLDLAGLYLQAGRTAEVKELAGAMGEIFRAKGIAREALAALSLFCDAARQERATVDLAKRVIAEVEKARRSASPA
jgi:transcriptional regulator with XRE-family HTH domain